jgi:hypothetical protein
LGRRAVRGESIRTQEIKVFNAASNPFSRRSFLKTTASGFGYLAFAGLSTWASQAARAAEASSTNPLAAKPPHFPARAKRVIFLCMDGGPSHVDTFDYKPRLAAEDGKLFQGRAGAPGFYGTPTIMGSPWKFAKHGQSGLWVSELFPEVAKHVDKLCIVNGMQTDIPNHPQAFAQMHTGAFQFKRPSMGAWTLYGLGTENQELPGFITLAPPANNGGPVNYGSSFLPAIYQGTRIGISPLPIADASISNVANHRRGVSSQRMQLDFIQSLNRSALDRDSSNPGVEGSIESFELAFRMQAAMPKVMDLAGESDATKKLYGIGSDSTDDFGRQCLLARRFVEAGVRFVELCHSGWDQHRKLREDHSKNCHAVDKPIAGLLADLASRDLLKDTLVIWGGEFGRTPYAQNGDGRDHNSKGYTMWMAGGGLKSGIAYGKTDEYGYEAIENKVHVHDWHATILHLLGLNHEKLTYRYASRDFRLTDVHGNVVKDIIA